jgi:hypothetical protein
MEEGEADFSFVAAGRVFPEVLNFLLLPVKRRAVTAVFVEKTVKPCR